MLLIFKMMSSFAEYFAIYNVLDEVISFSVAFGKPRSGGASSQRTYECWTTFYFSDRSSATAKEHLVINPSL